MLEGVLSIVVVVVRIDFRHRWRGPCRRTVCTGWVSPSVLRSIDRTTEHRTITVP